jgi:hypothetical protein
MTLARIEVKDKKEIMWSKKCARSASVDKYRAGKNYEFSSNFPESIASGARVSPEIKVVPYGKNDNVE